MIEQELTKELAARILNGIVPLIGFAIRIRKELDVIEKEGARAEKEVELLKELGITKYVEKLKQENSNADEIERMR